ncbi:MAG TPA: 50S ribosomal protein L18 [Mollicutes bacterium]|nr:50S ribosomal protein L18 [Mollicutes bacterium]
MIKKESRNDARKRRHERIRKNVNGTSLVPRLNVFRSNKNIFAQIIDDEKGITLVSASSLDKDLNIQNGSNLESAKLVGASIAKKAKEAKISKVVFDRGGYLYHGRVKALAEAARENGLEF